MRTLAGASASARRARRPRQAPAQGLQGAPRVGFPTTTASTTATVVELEALDRPGLLYDVARALFESGLSISSAIVSTMASARWTSSMCATATATRSSIPCGSRRSRSGCWGAVQSEDVEHA